VTDALLTPETEEHAAAKRLAEELERAARGREPPSLRQRWARLAGFGLFELLIPEASLDVDRALPVLEGLGEGFGEGGILLAIGAHCFAAAAPLQRFRAPHHDEDLGRLRDGGLLAAFAITEPESGSDAMSMKTTYREVDGGVVISGSKCFVTNACDADLFLVFATRDRRLHYRGVSAFLVPRGAPGLEIGRDEGRLGLHGCSVASVHLADVVVPESARVGRRDAGAAVFRHAMLWERTLLAAMHVGVLRRALAYSLDHARSRSQFGRPIGRNQYVAGRIVDQLGRYRTSRLLVWDSARKLAAGTLHDAEASLTKLHVSEAALASALDAYRLFGAMGFMEGIQALDDLRDALGGIVYSGTSDIQRVIIASHLGLES
jgi:alkylation response protein AidB-like acyl-CoA dehydrogenase